MKSVYAEFPSSAQPLAGLRFGEQAEPALPSPDWTVLTVRAASLNHHDLWTLRGAGLPVNRFPMILGCEASGVDSDGQEVLVSGMICAPEWSHEPVRDPRATLLSDGAPGTFGQRVAVPKYALVPKPAEFSSAEAACLSVTWLTAYRMLFTKAAARPGETVLIQGAGGGVSTSLIQLARAAGLRVWVTGRGEEKRAAALRLGAHQTFRAGAPLPEQVDMVMESVGKATWSHSIRSVRPGGTIVVTGATTGADPVAHLNRLFWKEIRVLGSTSGTVREMETMIAFMRLHELRPKIAAEIPFEHASDGFQQMIDGTVVGKIVFSWGRE